MIKLTQDELRAVARLAEAAKKDPEYRRWRFDGTFNLGHVFTIISFMIMAATVFVTQRINDVKRDYRIQALEASNLTLSHAMEKLAENQASIVKSVDRMAYVMETIGQKPQPK